MLEDQPPPKFAYVPSRGLFLLTATICGDGTQGIPFPVFPFPNLSKLFTRLLVYV